MRDGAFPDVEFRFVPFSLEQNHLDEADAPMWDRKWDEQGKGVHALLYGIALRERHPEQFSDAHLALFAQRHDHGKRFEEEVLVLKRRPVPKGGIVVGAGGGYVVMRWDGNCYTLDDGEIVTKKPPSPKHAPLQWHLYDTATKDALLKSAKVLAAFQRRGKECKGAMSGDVTKACEQADNALADAVVDEVRKGTSIPTPAKLP